MITFNRYRQLTSHITHINEDSTGHQSHAEASRYGVDGQGKRWEDYDYIRVPNKKGDLTAKNGKDQYGDHDLPDGTKYSVIDMQALLEDQERAKAVLTHLVPFFGAFVNKLRPVYTFHWPTQATDGYNLLINPWFTYNLTLEEKAFVFAHEIMHCVLNHMRRGSSHDPNKSNIAADYEVNYTLVDEFNIVSQSVINKIGALYDKKYVGWGYEKIYDDNPKGPSKSPENTGDDVDKKQGQQGKQGQSGSGGGGGNQQQNHSQDYKDGWNKAIADWKAGKIPGLSNANKK